jgi:hypothetical protein
MHGGRELVYEPVETAESNHAEGLAGEAKGRAQRQADGRPEVAAGARPAISKGRTEEGGAARQNSAPQKSNRKERGR